MTKTLIAGLCAAFVLTLARTLRVLLSDDGRAFREVYANDGSIFGGVRDGRPLRVPLGGAPARFVRLQLAALDYLHLDEVEVFEAFAAPPPPPPPPERTCADFIGRWRKADGALVDIRVAPDCTANVEGVGTHRDVVLDPKCYK